MRNLDQRQNGSSFIGNPKEMMDIQRKSCYLLCCCESWSILKIMDKDEANSKKKNNSNKSLQPVLSNDATCTSEDSVVTVTEIGLNVRLFLKM